MEKETEVNYLKNQLTKILCLSGKSFVRRYMFWADFEVILLSVIIFVGIGSNNPWRDNKFRACSAFGSWNPVEGLRECLLIMWKKNNNDTEQTEKYINRQTDRQINKQTDK